MRKEVSRPEPVRRSRSRKGGAPVLLSPGLLDSPVLDQLCTHFVLTLTLRQAGRFAGRRDWNSLLSLTARHLGRDLLHLAFVARGPKDDFHRQDWPRLLPSLAAVLRPAHRAYNTDPDFPGFAWREALHTVRGVLRR